MNKKRIVRLLLCLALILAVFPAAARANDGVAIDENNFPDKTLREYITAEFDADADGVLSAEEVDTALEVDLAGTETKDLTGLSVFTKLRSLTVSDTKVSGVAADKFPELETLNVNGCALTTLNVSKNPALKELDAANTRITKLDVSKNLALEILVINGCQIKKLDLSKNTVLTVLNCGKTALKELDVSSNTALTELVCPDIGLKTLDVTANKALEILNCGGNKLTKLNVKKNTKLRELRCQKNTIAALDVTANKALEHLNCSKNTLKSINVSENTALKALYCQGNKITALYLDKNAALERLNCSSNKITELSMKPNPLLEWLECGDNAINALNLTGNRWLKHLSCVNNKLSRLTLSKNPDLEWLECWGNDLHALDISSNEKLLDAFRYGSAEEYNKRTVRTYTLGDDVYEIGTDRGLLLQDGSVEAPRITTHPKSTAVVEGNRVTLKVSAVGQNLLYQWYYRTPNGDAWIKLSGETGRSYSFTAERKLDGRRYMCEVFNRGGLKQTEKAKLTVIYKPEIIYQPARQIVTEGKYAAFTVTARGSNLTYQWYRQTPDSLSWDKVTGGTNYRLTVTAKAAIDGAKYRCVVKNEAGSITSGEANLVVIFSPVITSQPKDITAKKGKTVTFSVRASGHQLQYQWYIKLEGETTWTPIKGATDRTLEVTVTTKKNNAKYRCRIFNDAGHINSETAKLYIKK